jgi:hypothetical protein
MQEYIHTHTVPVCGSDGDLRSLSPFLDHRRRSETDDVLVGKAYGAAVDVFVSSCMYACVYVYACMYVYVYH